MSTDFLQQCMLFLSQLLLAYWVLAAGSVLVTMLPLPVPQAFKDAVVLSACRGKLWQGKPAALGPLKDWSVPQVWFLHFYLIGAVCNALVVAYAASAVCRGQVTHHEGASSLVALVLFQLHLLRRAAETGLLMRYPQGAKMHGIAYVFGLSYYVAVPLTLIPAAWYQSLSTDLAALVPRPGEWAAACRSCLPAALRALTPLQLLGMVVMVIGQLLQCHLHTILARLPSQTRRAASGTTAYRIPRGGLFELVSCPHYMAEIVIYCGLALMLGGVQPAVGLILLWVVLNLVLAAKATHAWYHKTFKTYPAKRRALIPFIY